MNSSTKEDKEMAKHQRFTKGSKEAKEYMASIRRGGKGKRPATEKELPILKKKK